MIDASDLQTRLNELIQRHAVPGASVAVLSGGEIVASAAGVLNVATGVEATPDSVFQIGSISKVYTATVVMQLADEGLVDLDRPVAEYLPELKLADPDATKQVTPRHLLCHSSGIEGDLFIDTGRGDDCVERYVAACQSLGQTHPVGATMSYCNSGYVIAGRLIEVITGRTWDLAMKERLFAPLGLTNTVTLPEEVLLRRGAVGHSVTESQTSPVTTWSLPRSCGPAGLICATAEDVLGFARMHLDGGAGLLNPESVDAMQLPQITVPDPYTLGSHWGLGWILFDWGQTVIGHDGGTVGQSAFMRVVPAHGVAIALLTNGGHVQDLYRELCGGLLEELCGLSIPPRPEPPASPAAVDLDVHTGIYERIGSRIDVSRRNGSLFATVEVTGHLSSILPKTSDEHELVPVTQDLFVTRPPGTETWAPMTFFRLADGRPYLHFGMRATPKVG